MRISLIERDERDCQPGYDFYDCGKERFRGCCQVEACKFPGGCPRANLPLSQPSRLPKPTTTVASVAAPVLASQTAAKLSSSRGAGITFFGPGATSTTAGGAWYSDKNSVPTLTVVSLGPSSIETQGLNTSAPAEAKDAAELSPAARGAIIGTVAAIVFAIIAAYFLCGKQRRKLRSRDDSISSTSGDGSKAGVEEEEGNPPTSVHFFRPDDVSPFGGRYEELQTRFNRTSDMSPGSQMLNHPVSPESREPVVLQPPVVPARSATASPEFLSRLDTATPELQGPPQQAAIAALAFPGLPKVVEIHSRSGQKYKPYRPCGALYPVAETTPTYLTGTLNATKSGLTSVDKTQD